MDQPDQQQPSNGGSTASKIVGFFALGLGCAMVIAAVGAPLPLQHKIALGIFGIFGCYWGLRFQRLGRGQS